MAAASGPDRLAFNVVLIGDATVGKSALIVRCADSCFNPYLPATVQPDLLVLSYLVGGRQVCLKVWDTAGQERFKAMNISYFRQAAAVVFVYSVACERSFRSLPTWMTDVREQCPEGTKRFLVAAKADLQEQRQVSADRGREFAERCGMPFWETSAMTGENVQLLFSAIARRLEETSRLESALSDSESSLQLTASNVGMEVDGEDASGDHREVATATDGPGNRQRKCCGIL